MRNFLIIAPINCVTYKEVFPLIKENKMWAGYNFNKTMYFEMPGTYSGEDAGNGNKIGKVPAICWLTNLEHNKRHQTLELTKTYNPSDYPKYDELDCIRVSETCEIPKDYGGLMGVPVSFLAKYCPEQFEILDGLNRYTIYDYFGTNEDVRKRKSHSTNVNGKATFFAILIKRK